ncbi:MAG: hypothetical protein ACLR6B_03000 [Blautia sp.]
MEYKALFKEYKRLIKHFDQNSSMEKWREDVRTLAATDEEKAALIDYLNFRKRRLNTDLDQQGFSITIVVMVVLLARYFSWLSLAIIVPLMAIWYCMSMNRELKKMFYNDCIEVLADSVSKNET